MTPSLGVFDRSVVKVPDLMEKTPRSVSSMRSG